MKAKLEYTKLNGTRNTVEFSSIERLQDALAKTKASNPGHDMREVISVQEKTGIRTEFYVAFYCDGQWEAVPGLPPSPVRSDLEYELSDCRRNYGKCRIQNTETVITQWVELQPA